MCFTQLILKGQEHQEIILKMQYFNTKNAVINTNKMQEKHTVERDIYKLRNRFIGVVQCSI